MLDLDLISWNVAGIRACVEKGMINVFNGFKDADIISVQETKIQPYQSRVEVPGYPYSYWAFAQKPGYSGVACFSKVEPLSVLYGIGLDEFDTEGRVLTLELGEFFLVNVYKPNSQKGLRRLPYRTRFDEAFMSFVVSLEKVKPVIICGDFNVAHMPIDLRNPTTNINSAGFSMDERLHFQLLLDAGYVDSLRYFYPNVPNVYTYWSYMRNAYIKDIGWRLDYFLVSNKMRERMSDVKVYKKIRISDHCPIGLTL